MAQILEPAVGIQILQATTNLRRRCGASYRARQRRHQLESSAVAAQGVGVEERSARRWRCEQISSAVAA